MLMAAKKICETWSMASNVRLEGLTPVYNDWHSKLIFLGKIYHGCALPYTHQAPITHISFVLLWEAQIL